MTKAEYFAFHEHFCQALIDITKAKNADYTGGNEDPFANFTLIERLNVATTEQGFMTRMTDKVARLASFVSQGKLQVKNESATDALMDLANYCILFAGYLHSKAFTTVQTTVGISPAWELPLHEMVSDSPSAAQRAAEVRAR